MNPKSAIALNRIIGSCQTLAEADIVLQNRKPTYTMAARWGLWDGFADRPWSVAGLSKEPVPDEIRADYDQAYQAGKDAARAGNWRTQ